MNRWLAYLKKDGWLLAALGMCVALCLMLGAFSSAAGQPGDDVSRVLSAIAGAGTVDVAVYYDDTVPCGAVVVADGADDVAVRLDLMSAVTALLGIERDRVAVYPREGQ